MTMKPFLVLMCFAGIGGLSGHLGFSHSTLRHNMFPCLSARFRNPGLSLTRDWPKLNSIDLGASLKKASGETLSCVCAFNGCTICSYQNGEKESQLNRFVCVCLCLKSSLGDCGVIIQCRGI